MSIMCCYACCGISRWLLLRVQSATIHRVLDDIGNLSQRVKWKYIACSEKMERLFFFLLSLHLFCSITHVLSLFVSVQLFVTLLSVRELRFFYLKLYVCVCVCLWGSADWTDKTVGCRDRIGHRHHQWWLQFLPFSGYHVLVLIYQSVWMMVIGFFFASADLFCVESGNVM